jgi:hypothetical protein
MKVKIDNKRWFDEMYGHAVLNGMTHIQSESISEEKDWVDNRELDIEFTINGHAIDLKDFFTRLEKSMNENVKNGAKEMYEDIYRDKMIEVEDKLEDLGNILKDSIEKESKKDTDTKKLEYYERALSPECGGEFAGPVNDMGWEIQDMPKMTFNDTKPIFCEMVKKYKSVLDKNYKETT